MGLDGITAHPSRKINAVTSILGIDDDRTICFDNPTGTGIAVPREKVNVLLICFRRALWCYTGKIVPTP